MADQPHEHDDEPTNHPAIQLNQPQPPPPPRPPPALVVPDRLTALNMLGIEHLVEMRHQQAKTVFYSAITEINQQQRHIIEQPAGQDGQGTNQTDPLLLNTSQSIAQQVTTPYGDEGLATARGGEAQYPLADPPRIDQDDHNAFRVYDKAFIVSGIPVPPQERTQGTGIPATRPIPLNESSLARIAAVVMYNAALAHHLRGLCTIDTQEFDYQRSLSLYRIASRLLAVNEGDGERTRLLLMGCYNNMAHIYIHFFDNRNFRRCLNGLRQVLAMGEPSEEDAHFALNLLVAQNMEGQSAATA